MIRSVRIRAYFLLFGGMAVVGAYVAFSKLILETVPVFFVGIHPFCSGGTRDVAVDVSPWRACDGARPVQNAGFAIVLRKFSFFDLHALGCRANHCDRCRHHHEYLAGGRRIVSFITLKEAMGWKTAAAISMALLGVATLTRGRAGAPQHPAQWTGNLLMVGAVCGAAL